MNYCTIPFGIICFSIILLSFSSCSDDEGDEVQPILVEDLSGTYITSVTIINVPPFYWDNGSSPDLQLSLALQTSNTWTYTTNKVDNVEKVPQILNFSDRIYLTDEEWELLLIDQDDLNSDDEIYRLSFNPMKDAKDGIIPIYTRGLLVMEFNYTSQ